mgnify:CR=1 FL=1
MTTKELVKAFNEVCFSIGLFSRVYLAILCGVRLQSFLYILVYGIRVIKIELRFK